MASLTADLYKELRRLAIAGGELGAGDLRLAKILPQLKGAAEKAPIFGKLAAGVEKIGAPETADRSALILETAALARAVMCVQAKPEPVEGELRPLPATGLDTAADQFSYRVIEPIREALAAKGGRRRDALDEGLKNGAAGDVRLLDDLLEAIDGSDGTIGLLAGRALEKIGRPAVPGLLAAFKPKSKRNSDLDRLEVLGHILGTEGQEIYARAWTEGSAPVRRKAVEFLALNPENDPVLLEALAGEDPLLAEAAAFGLVKARRVEMAAYLAEAAADLLGQLRLDDFSQRLPDQSNVRKVTQDKARQFLRFLIFLTALARLEQPQALELGQAALAVEPWRSFDLIDLAALPGVYLPDFMQLNRQGTIHGFCLKAISGYDPATVLAEIRAGLAVPEPDAGLVIVGAKYGYRTLDPAEFYELFRPLLKKGKTEIEKALIELLSHLIDFGAPDLPLGDPAGRRPLDPRWAQAAAELDLTRLTARLAAPGLPEVAKYLEKKLTEALTKPGLGHRRFHTTAYEPLRGLVQMGERAFIKTFMATLKNDYFLRIMDYPETGPDTQLLAVVPQTLELMTLVPRDSFELLVDLYKHPLKKEIIVSSFIDGFREQLALALGEETAASLDWAAHGIPQANALDAMTTVMLDRAARGLPLSGETEK